MLIGIEASRANRRQKTGVEWYAFNIIQELKKLPEAAAHSWLLYSNAPLMNGLEIGPANWHERQLKWPPKYLWTQARLSWEMVRRPPEALFVPAHVLPRFTPRHSVVTIHDVGFHRHPHLYKPIQVRYHEWSTRDIVKNAGRILTVSEFSKREIVDCYGADPARIHVVYPGLDRERFRVHDQEQSRQILSGLRLPVSFFLFIGRLEKKKNVLTLIEAFHRFKERRGLGDPMHLLLVGQSGAGYDEIEKAIVSGPAHAAIRTLGYVSEAEKAALLSLAAAYIHPAWYEGFGLPPLEAMACDCPVISSNAASLPEALGQGNALFFAPNDAEGLISQMVKLVDNPDVRRDLVARGRDWCGRYGWEKTARQILPLLTNW